MTMRERREAVRILLAGFSTLVTLTACGGGKDNEPGELDLDGAYELIAQGMSYKLVSTVVGGGSTFQQAEGKTQTLYIWERNKGTYQFTRLLVMIDENLGVLSKIVTGYKGNKSQTYQ